jgi:cellobiose-specific phosphotransferase system component IIA
MSPINYVNAVKMAQDNLDEANRQLAKATTDFAEGHIPEARLLQLHELRDIAAADLVRVVKEN